MNLDVALGGHHAEWRFLDSRRLGGWLGERPWSSRGGAVAVRLPGPRARELFFEVARRRLYLLGGANSRLHSVVLDGAVLGRGLAAALVAEVGVATSARPHELKRNLADALRSAPLVVFVETPPGPAGPALATEAALLTEELSKQYRTALTIIFADTPGALSPSLRAFDFTVGEPTDRVLEWCDERVLLWSAYVHARLAWDSCGDLERAMEWDASAGTPAEGDDAGLERALTARACQEAAPRAAALEAARRRLEASLADPTGEAASVPCWSPIGSGVTRITPWFARWCLSAGAPPALRALLRGPLVCSPLAAEILSRCLELEGQYRMEWVRRGGGAGVRASEGAQRLFERNRSGEAEGIRYPAAHPGPPTEAGDVWDFATLGEVLKNAPPPGAGAPEKACDDVRALRNAIAHGHYVCWWHVLEVVRLRTAGRRLWRTLVAAAGR